MATNLQPESLPIRFAGDVSIGKISITTSGGFSQDISAQVINIQIYEDLFAPFITGSLIIKESLDLVNLFPFVGEEFLELEISTPSLPNGNLSATFYIHKLTDRELLGDRSVVYQLHFISTEAIVDLNKKISKTYIGKISEIAERLITGDDGLESDKKVYVEDTSNNLKYISNYWSPVENIMYLTETANNVSPSYVFFENRDGFYFVSLDKLYQASVYQEFVYDKYVRDIGPGGRDYRNVTEDFKRILSISIPTGYDYMDRIRSGMLSSKITSFDVTKKVYNVKTYNMFKNFSKQHHLNEYSVNSNKAIFKNNSLIINYKRMFRQFDGAFDDTSNYDTLQERISLMKLARAHRLNVSVLGRMDYTVGLKVKVNLNKIEPFLFGEDVTDKMFSGNYLISAINHYIDRDKHECHMELIKESSMINLN